MINNNKSNTKLNSANSTPIKDSSKGESEPSANSNKEMSVPSQSNLAAAASFFAKAAKKPITTGTELTSSIKRKKKLDHTKLRESEFATCFSEILKTSPPPVPPALLKTALNRPLGYNAGKIKVIVRLKYLETSKPDIHQNMSPSQTCISIDSTKKQITVFESQSSNSTPRRINTNIPKIYAFDAVYTDDDDPTELCSNALTDIIQSVVSGIDGCVFSFGHLRASSNLTMIGSDQQIRKLGLIPCAISWLFRLICEQKEKTGARFSVRVSAIEVHGKQEILKDLLSDIEVIENVGQCSPGVYLRDDPVSGTQLQNQSELRAPTAEKAAYYLDAALAARTLSFTEEDTRLSHFLFTLHVYQYRVERGTTGSAVAGGRSRLHMLDFGSGKILQQSDSNNKETPPTDLLRQEFQLNSTALSLSATAAVLLALVNGQRHIPYRTSKLSQLLREAMSSLSCRTCMVAHIAMNTTHYADSMQIIQFASKLQRLKKRKFSKLSGTSSDDSSSCDSFGFRRASRHRGGNAGFSSGSSTNGMTSSEADYTSSSEQSCDTVIYLGASRNKIGEEHSTFMLRKRRISAPSFTNAIPERSGSESDLLKLDISKHHISAHQHLKASVRTNALVWPRVAAKNAVETLSTQKEMWVDGPMVSSKTSNPSTDSNGNQSKFVNTETQTYTNEHILLFKDNHNNQTKSDASQNIENHSQILDVNVSSQESSSVNTVSVTSTNSTSNDNPSSQESTTAAVGSSDGDQKLIDVSVSSSILSNSHLTSTSNIHSSTNISSQFPSIANQTITTLHPISATQAYKPFVWDWVEKHSDMIVDAPSLNPSDTYPFQVEATDDSQSPQKRSAKHCAKHQQLLKKARPCVTNEQIAENNEREGRKRHKSSRHKTAQTPNVHDSFKVNPINSPSVEPNFTRVAEWVRSVSEETNRAQSLSPVRRNNTVKENKSLLHSNDNMPTNYVLQSNANYRSLDRHAQGFITISQPINYPNAYLDSTDLSNSSIQYPYIPAGSRTFDSIPLPSNQIYQHDIKKSQNSSKHSSQKIECENQLMNSPLKRGNSQKEEIATNLQKFQNQNCKQSINSSSKHNNKNSPTRQTLERNSPSKLRSSSLIKNALFGRCKLSSSGCIDDTNQYSVPNSPCKNKTAKNSNKIPVDLFPVNNTGGYHYVVMTSSLSTPAKHLQEESSKAIKRRSSSTSPGKSSGSSTDKKQLVNLSRKEKAKDKVKEGKCDKTKIKKESKKKLGFLTSPLFGKKKEKEKHLISTVSKQTKSSKNNPQPQICTVHHCHQENSKVISPYCTVTQPKHSAHSSSGHGSDCSSIYGHQHKFAELPGHIKCRECTNIDEEGSCLNHIDQCNIDQHQLLRRSQRRGGGHTSSGYESIMRDSEVSSQNDSTSESSLGAAPRAQTPEKQQSQSSSSSSKQSRSAPNRSEETSEDTQSPVSVRKMSPKTGQKNQINDLQKKENEIKKIAKQIQFEKIYDLLAQQDMLKTELLQSKERILVDPTSWSYDLHVVEQMDPEDSSFIEALEKETDILRRRVEACKSHVLLITYFDIKYRYPLIPEVKGHSSKMENTRKSAVVGSTGEPNLTDVHRHLKS